MTQLTAGRHGCSAGGSPRRRLARDATGAGANRRRKRRREAQSRTSWSSWATTSAGSIRASTTAASWAIETPNIDRIGKEGAMFTDWYGQQSCTAGRAAFVTGQSPIRTGLTKVGLPGADIGLRQEDPSVAEFLKPLGYATGQFGKNHLGDKDEFLPTEPRLRRVLRQPLPPERRGGAGEPGLPEEPRVPEAVRPARRDPLLRRRQDRGHRPAHQEAHGDGRRGVPRPRRSTSSTASTRPASRSSATSTRRACTSSRT